jgi:hypothetical protein
VSQPCRHAVGSLSFAVSIRSKSKTERSAISTRKVSSLRTALNLRLTLSFSRRGTTCRLKICDIDILLTSDHRFVDSREGMRPFFGDDINQCKPIWGINDEEELNGTWRRAGPPGLWYTYGRFLQAGSTLVVALPDKPVLADVLLASSLSSLATPRPLNRSRRRRV